MSNGRYNRWRRWKARREGAHAWSIRMTEDHSSADVEEVKTEEEMDWKETQKDKRGGGRGVWIVSVVVMDWFC